MDIIESNLVNAIREIVKQEIKASVAENLDYMTRADIEQFIADDGYTIIADEIDEAVGNYLRNNVTIELNC